jgi:hypothetical protein
MPSIEVRILREALIAGRLSPLEVATYIRTLRRELREVERLAERSISHDSPKGRFLLEDLLHLDPNYCYSVKELALVWNMSAESIRRLFVREPGTLIFKFSSTGRRSYRNIRVPGIVALRVQKRMTVVAPERRR